MSGCQAVEALPADARQSDADWPGVVWQVGGLRLALTGNGDAYALQREGRRADGSPVWVSVRRPSRTLAALLAKHGQAGLARLCEGLPDDPGALWRSSGLAHRRAALDVAHGRRLPRCEEYAGVLFQDGTLRVALSPCGGFYLLQWTWRDDFLAGYSERWKNQCQSPENLPLAEFLAQHVRNTHEPGALPAPDLHDFIMQLPLFASDCDWPGLPELP